MEKIKRIIQQVVTTGSTQYTGCTGMCEYHTTGLTHYIRYGGTNVVLIPDENKFYNIKISITSNNKDFGFFDAENNTT